MGGRIRISLTGQLRLEVGDKSLDAVALGPLGTIGLAFLVTERDRPVPRDELAEVLWGDELPSTWEPSLRSVISRVRRRLEQVGLPGDMIVGGGGCYQLRLPADAVVDIEAAAADLDRARAAASRKDWTKAYHSATSVVAVTTRPFLAGVRGLWVEERQAEVVELHVQALETFSETASAVGEHAGAVSAADAAIAIQPLRESAHRRAMAAHAAGGSRGEALRAYERCRRILADELGAFPSPETEAAYLALLEPAAEDLVPNKGPRTNLGVELSSFVGRAEHMTMVEKLLATSRLVTLTGPGGVGKTRLAVRVAAELVDHYRHGAWLVELAPLGDGDLVAQHVMAALGLAETGGSGPLASLSDHLAERELVLVLDNCEHLSDACAALVRELLSRGPDLRVLATSREPLGVPGETVWPVPALSLPDSGDRDRPNGVWDSEAVRLFTERAAEAVPGVVFSRDDLAAVAEICRRVDGLPLAIELAAAWTRSLSVPEIAALLEDRFRVLVGRERAGPDRHRTLRATVGWSFERLPQIERLVFCQLSVFAGGFTMEAAEAVCGGDTADKPDLLEVLGALVDKSLVVADRSGPRTRYRLLETLRQYGDERLAAGGGRTAVRDRHAAWVAALAARAEVGLEGPDQAEWLGVLDTEEDNVRAALEWAIGRPAPEEGLRLASAMWRFWQVRGRPEEGRGWLQTLLDLTRDAPPALRAKATTSAAVLASEQLDLDSARSLFERSLSIQSEVADRRGVASALHGLGGVLYRQGDVQGARGCFEQTLYIGRELDDSRVVAASLNNLAVVARRVQETGASSPATLDPRALYEESLPLWRGLGDDFSVAKVLADMGGLAMAEGDLATARTQLGESAAIRRRLGDRRGMAESAQQLARLATLHADRGDARSLLEQSLTIQRELPVSDAEVYLLLRLADMSLAEADHSAAATYRKQALTMGRALKSPVLIAAALTGVAIDALVQGRLSDAERWFEEAQTVAGPSTAPGVTRWLLAVRAVLALATDDVAGAGRACRDVLQLHSDARGTPSNAVAMVLDVLAVIAVGSGDLERAARLLGAADCSRTTGSPAVLRCRPEYQRSLLALRQGLSDSAFEAQRSAGAAMTLDELVGGID